ncbi:hypothetical protein LJR231_003139 [Phyllobacterium sp. LjRoot231]|uniref:hypothetical protein n=1 Tax=Phyllobacterium sp. LjRoot231 TaxID=3342289 RepID=UPI003ECFA1EE
MELQTNYTIARELIGEMLAKHPPQSVSSFGVVDCDGHFGLTEDIRADALLMYSSDHIAGQYFDTKYLFAEHHAALVLQYSYDTWISNKTTRRACYTITDADSGEVTGRIYLDDSEISDDAVSLVTECVGQLIRTFNSRFDPRQVAAIRAKFEEEEAYDKLFRPRQERAQLRQMFYCADGTTSHQAT